MDIEDPVEDQAGYVYERWNVEKYIKEKHGSVECPVSGKHTLFYESCLVCTGPLCTHLAC